MWPLVVALALLVLLTMIFVFRVPRAATTAIASALAMGLAGYALQGAPDRPGAPKRPAADDAQAQDGLALVEARKRFFAKDRPQANHMILADAFMRRGHYAEAAGVLRGAVRDHPDDAEAWLALATALSAHADGTLAAPALRAFDAARKASPGNPGPDFFIGVSELRAGRLIEAHKAWTAAVRGAAPDAPGRAEVEQRLRQLDALIRRLAGQ